MTINPLVSIIINMYNAEKYIREAVQSIIDQKYKNWELILWDNCSTDSTKKIIDEFEDNRIRYFLAPKHTNLGAARHLAITNCKGSWFGFLDSDDTWTIEKLNLQIKMINKYKIKGFIFTNVNVINEGNNTSQWAKNFNLKNTNFSKKEKLYDALLKKNFIFISTVLFNINFYNEKNSINTSLYFAEDYDLLLKYSKISSYYYLNKKLVNYRIHENNLSGNLEFKNLDEIVEIIKSHLPDKKANNALNYQLTLYLLKFIKDIRLNLIMHILKINKNPFRYIHGLYLIIINKIL